MSRPPPDHDPEFGQIVDASIRIAVKLFEAIDDYRMRLDRGLDEYQALKQIESCCAEARTELEFIEDVLKVAGRLGWHPPIQMPQEEIQRTKRALRDFVQIMGAMVATGRSSRESN